MNALDVHCHVCKDIYVGRVHKSRGHGHMKVIEECTYDNKRRAWVGWCKYHLHKARQVTLIAELLKQAKNNKAHYV